MKKLSITAALFLTSNMAFGFSFSNLAEDILKTSTTLSTQTTTPSSTTSNLSNSVITDGLKEALKIGVEYGVKELSKKDGYLNNKDVKIPLPENLAKTESLLRQLGGDKIADDLIKSMNDAATQAAPKTATIFVDAVNKMNLDDARKILDGGDEAATEYFETHTSISLTQMIKPIVQMSMEDNNVAKHYDTFNDFYKNNMKETVESSSVMGMAKSFGVDAYIPSSSDENLDDFVTKKAISGLFSMIASKEAQIRKDPIAQTTSLLKSVFGN